MFLIDEYKKIIKKTINYVWFKNIRNKNIRNI